MIESNEKELTFEENNEILKDSAYNEGLDSKITEGGSVDPTPEKLETKGLKLKKSTKERLNALQSTFGDAETLISTLINQYESITIQNDSRYSDRKAEIEKFNYLLDSIRSSYLNSLDMATFLEEKYNEKYVNEIKTREKIILSLQEENSELKKSIKQRETEAFNLESELKETKDNFNRINGLLTTIENDNKEKSTLINNLQNHINSLTEESEENKKYKLKIDEMQNHINSLQKELVNYEFSKKEVSSLNSEIDRLKNEISDLKEDLKNERNYSNSINDKLHNLILINSNENSKIKEKYNDEIRRIEAEKSKISEESSKMIAEYKDEIYALKLELEKFKTK